MAVLHGESGRVVWPCGAAGAGIGIGGGSSGNFNLLSNGANNKGSSMAGMGLAMEPPGIILDGEFSSP